MVGVNTYNQNLSTPLTLMKERYAPKNKTLSISNCLTDSIDFIANIKQVLQYMPGIVCWKDTSSTFLGCNEYAAQLGGLTSASNINGKRDYDMIWGQGGYADAFIADDQEVLSGIARLNIGRYLYADKKYRTMIIKKFPLLNTDGTIVGSISCLNEVPIATLQNILFAIENHGVQINDPELIAEINTRYTDEAYHAPNLTKREKQVLYYLVRGSSAKLIGEQLFLSPRTIQDYIDNLKVKLDCQNKSQIIEKVFTSGFIHEILMDKKLVFETLYS